MRTRWRAPAIAGLAVAVGCSERPKPGAWHGPPPSITVGISAPVQTDTVRAFRVPVIEFPALTMPDPRGGGYMIAEGSINEQDARFVHPGDSASLLLAHRRREILGLVAKAGSTGVPYPYSAQVTVRFLVGSESLAPNLPLIVRVTPIGAGDSLPSVPADAVVSLPIGGDAVFASVGPGRFQVLWVWKGPAMGDRILIRAGLGRGAIVATSELSSLADAARDSLAQRSAGVRR